MKFAKVIGSVILTVILVVPLTAMLVLYAGDQIVSEDTIASSLGDTDHFDVLSLPQIDEFVDAKDANIFVSHYISGFFSSYLMGGENDVVSESDVRRLLGDYLDRCAVSGSDIAGASGTYTYDQLVAIADKNSAMYAQSINAVIPDEDILPTEFGGINIQTVRLFFSATARAAVIVVAALAAALLAAVNQKNGRYLTCCGIAFVIASIPMFAAGVMLNKALGAFGDLSQLADVLIADPVMRSGFVGLGAGALLITVGEVLCYILLREKTKNKKAKKGAK